MDWASYGDYPISESDSDSSSDYYWYYSSDEYEWPHPGARSRMPSIWRPPQPPMMLRGPARPAPRPAPTYDPPMGPRRPIPRRNPRRLRGRFHVPGPLDSDSDDEGYSSDYDWPLAPPTPPGRSYYRGYWDY
ncbi:unnamed protein product [Periconia digitata]|uniref:Uncharacterized protein n=1 Tax=Periconia digitata TaxID=1303443 RepID=A0A9W4XKG5_9PLEO|nr:unnamed protein product [Periconia digitata]